MTTSVVNMHFTLPTGRADGAHNRFESVRIATGQSIIVWLAKTQNNQNGLKLSTPKQNMDK